MSQDTKYCKDCKFFLLNKEYKPDEPSATKFALCGAFTDEKPGSDAYHLISPDIRPPAEFHYCNVARGLKWLCGPEGQSFEATGPGPEALEPDAELVVESLCKQLRS